MLDGKKLTNKSTHAAKTLIQVSKLAGRKDDKEKLSRDDLHSEERLGIAIGLLRRRKKITYEILALETGFRVELLMALESGTLDRKTVNQILPKVLRGIGISSQVLNRVKTIK